MKKKYYLLFILCLILIPFNEVKGKAELCGWRYYKGVKGYVKWYEQGSNGYCGPSHKDLEIGRGYSAQKPYKIFDYATCDSSTCEYSYISWSTCNGSDGKKVSIFPKEIETYMFLWEEFKYCRIKLYYNSPPSKDKFETVSEGQCLKEKQTGKYVRSDGGKYDLSTKYGYDKANEQDKHISFKNSCVYPAFFL